MTLDRVIEARTDPFTYHELEALLQDQKPLEESAVKEPYLPRKRRKLSTKRPPEPAITGDGGESFTTLALLHLKIYTQASPSKIISSDHFERASSVALTKFEGPPSGQLLEDQYFFSLGAADGSFSLDFTARARLKTHDQEFLQSAVSLRLPRRGVRARSTSTLHRLSGSHIDSVDLLVRILLPNAVNLLDDAGLPRKAGLLKFFPRKAPRPFGPWCPQDFYDHVHTPSKDKIIQLDKVRELQCHLYPFQRRAVGWMLEREGALPSSSKEETLPHGFVSFSDGDGRKRFISSLLGLATDDQDVINSFHTGMQGAGLLAEEMGLGKTVEVIALICLHRRPEPVGLTRSDGTSATLIIAPPAILQQWKDELKALAPNLRVATYEGMKMESTKDDNEIQLKFKIHDIILTTYPIIARDIYHAEGPTKHLRHEKRYEKRLSPLTQLQFWRVILDEAQMVESGVSNAAKVASLIPSHNRWCVSGTPARTSRDLLGLITFLRIQPYCSLPSIWDNLVENHRHVLHTLFNSISLRHTKRQIGDEIVLPAQKRVVITIPFTPVEEQHYSGLFQQMTDECGLDLDGAPVHGSWNPDDGQMVEKMRTWLVRLRQTCLHPEVGSRNRKALGSSKGPLRTVAEVLEVMIDQNESAARSEERTLLLSRIRRGQILEHAEYTQEALDIWLATLAEAVTDVQDCRCQLQAELDQPSGQHLGVAPEGDEDDPQLNRAGTQRQRLRNALELEHMCTFFVANAYFQLKTKEISAYQKAESRHNGLARIYKHDAKSSDASEENLLPIAKELERKEEQYYEKARLLRQELLTESRRKAGSQLDKIKIMRSSLCNIPPTPTISDHGGLQSYHLLEKLSDLTEMLQKQKATLIAWRTKSVELLVLPLVDQEQTELTGDEYEASTKQQDEVYVYVDAFRAIVSDRHGMITGQVNKLVDHEMNLLLRDASEGRGHSPQLLIRLLHERDELRRTRFIDCSLRGLSTGLREIKTNLRGLIERGNSRAAAESLIVDRALHEVGQIASEQTKAVVALAKEVDMLKAAMNVRLEYYRQLQSISDTVAPYEENLTEEERQARLIAQCEAENKTRDKIASLRSKGRYLIHIREETDSMSTQKTCIICTSSFENGILTTCGHTYCADCLRLWWNQHRNCPTCKKHLRRNDFHQITYKPKELTIEEESSGITKGTTPSESGSSIYSNVQETLLNEIKDIDLEGSFGTKIDTIGRHLLWIREHDPGAKSIIFSQYRDFLDVLARAFSHFKIAYSTIDGKDGIQKFRNDPHIECFFLHAKAQSSGLNLVNATHVFLCEPLINTAIELQAIARVHRIGQHNETTVWMYLVEGTVEKSIYDISVQRRLAHMGEVDQNFNGTGQKTLESRLEVANSQELEQTSLTHLLSKGSSGGELVRKEDLWSCLFSSRPNQPEKVTQAAKMSVAQHLGADAAEARMAES